MDRDSLNVEIIRIKEGSVGSTNLSIDNYAYGRHSSVNQIDDPLEYMEGYISSLVHVLDLIDEDCDIEDYGFTESDVNSCISKCDEILNHTKYND